MHSFMPKYFQYLSVFTACIVVSSSLFSKEVDPPQLPETSQLQPFIGLGSSSPYKWENGEVPIAYNAANSPEHIALEDFEQLLFQAFDMLEGLADVQFNYLGETNASIEDYTDGVVAIGWEDLHGTALGLATLNTLLSDDDDYNRLGYHRPTDGTVWLHSILEEGELPTLSTMVHELIHILGFGHSENPRSIMNYTYHFYDLPQQEDINGLQAVYGPPDVFLRPIDARVIELEAPEGVRSIFVDQDNSRLLHGTQRDDYEEFLKLDDGIPDEHFVFYQMVLRNANAQHTISIQLFDAVGNLRFTETMTSPDSYEVSNVYLGRGKNVKVEPGFWTVRVGIDGVLLEEVMLEIQSTPTPYNQAPISFLEVEQITSTVYELRLHTADEEGDPYRIDWIIPGRIEATDSTNNRVVLLDDIGVYEVIVETHDDVDRNVDGRQGRGYNAFNKAILTVSPQEHVPSYFIEEELLVIPEIEIEGAHFILFFKLTKLEGEQLKLVEFRPVKSEADPLSTLDLETGLLELEKINAVDSNGQIITLGPVTFQLNTDANPVRIKAL